MAFMACYLKKASFRNTNSHFLSYTLRYGCCILFYHTATKFKALGFYPGHQVAHLCPSSSPKSLSSRRFRDEHAIHKTEDIQNKGEGKGQVDNTASELMAISTQTSTIFALPEATWFESVSTWPENILLIQDSGSMFQCVSTPSSFPSQEILLVWKQAEGDSYLPEWQWDFHPENAKYTNKQHVQRVNKDLKTQKKTCTWSITYELESEKEMNS